MDPYVERELIDCLKTIALSLKNMEKKMDDISLAIREANATIMDEEVEGDDPTVKFEVDEVDASDSAEDIEGDEAEEGEKELI